MKISYATDIGQVRSKNEDYVATFTNQTFCQLALLADGLGAYHGGEVASKMTVEELGKLFQSTTLQTVEAAVIWLDQAIAQINHQLVQSSHDTLKYYGMATTLVGFLFLKEKVVIFHVGDSRAYEFTSDQLKLLTHDHSLVFEMYQLGYLTKTEAERHNQRNQLTRVIGCNDKIKVDYLIKPINPQALYLLCSDGLTKMLSEDQIANILNTPGSLSPKVQKLIQAAKQAGGYDNVTVLLAKAEGVKK